MITPTQEHKFTSDQPYNRHKYKLVFVDGRSIVFDDYSQMKQTWRQFSDCLLYTSPSPRDGIGSRMPSSA